MAAALGDIIRITDRQTLLGQQVLNVYFYRVQSLTGITGDYLDLFASTFQDVVLDDVKNIQHVELQHVGLFLENITNGVDIAEYTDGFPQGGMIDGGDVMPPFVSFGFQLLRESRTTRNGYKRFGGVPEDSVTDGVYTGAGGDITAVEEALGQDFQSGLVTFAAPVILKHPIEVPLVDGVYNDISAGLFRGIGSQNTRKFGRGV